MIATLIATAAIALFLAAVALRCYVAVRLHQVKKQPRTRGEAQPQGHRQECVESVVDPNDCQHCPCECAYDVDPERESPDAIDERVFAEREERSAIDHDRNEKDRDDLRERRALVRVEFHVPKGTALTVRLSADSK